MHPELASRLSLVAAVATMVVWGANFAVTKYVLDAIGVGPFLFIRFLTMPLLGFALLALVYRRHLTRSLPRRADLPRFVAAGLVGHTLHVGIVSWGIDLSTAFSSSLVLTSGPVFTLLILALLGAERLRRRQVAGTLLAFGGIVVFLWDKFAGGFSLAGVGDLVLLFASALFSIYTVIIKPLVLITLPSWLAAPLASVPAGAWFGMFWAAVVSAFFGWLVWVWVNAVRGVARSAPLMYLMPPISGVVAWLLLGEQFTPLKLAGAAITMAGVAWAQLAGRGGEDGARAVAQPDSG